MTRDAEYCSRAQIFLTGRYIGAVTFGTFECDGRHTGAFGLHFDLEGLAERSGAQAAIGRDPTGLTVAQDETNRVPISLLTRKIRI